MALAIVEHGLARTLDGPRYRPQSPKMDVGVCLDNRLKAFCCMLGVQVDGLDDDTDVSSKK
jgi:hypothetical protein